MGLDNIVGSTPLLSADRRNLSGVTVRVIACRCTFASLPRFLISHLHLGKYGYWAWVSEMRLQPDLAAPSYHLFPPPSLDGKDNGNEA